MYSYFALFSPESDGKIFVYFPDLNVATCGDDMNEAIFMAKDALRTHIKNLLEDEEDIPQSSSLYEVKEKAKIYCNTIDVTISHEASYQSIRVQTTESEITINIAFEPTVLNTIGRNTKDFSISHY